MMVGMITITIVEVVRADNINVRAGVDYFLCEGLKESPSLGVGYEYRWKQLGIEAGVDGYATRVSDRAYINVLDYSASLKVYLPYEIYVLGGIDYLDTYVVENYNGQADCDDEIGYHLGIGKMFGDWFIEARRIEADLDIESYQDNFNNTSPNYGKAGLVEDRSNLREIRVTIGRRF